MKRILVGVCSTRNHKKFWDSFFNLMNELKESYDVSAQIIKDINLPDAQNQLAENFIMARYDYLLLLDDDHWGHTKEMVDTLVNANTYMATIKSYSRHYPYSCALMKKFNKGYAGIENGEGYQECDLTGFPMTLMKKDLFDKLDKPYFRPTKGDTRSWATDKNFCEKIIEKGIKPMGCFQHCLPHDDITEENVYERRYDERSQHNNVALYTLFNHNQRSLKCTDLQPVQRQ